MPDAQAWSARYELGSIPWDLGRAHPDLEERLDRDASLGVGSVGSALVPGAGTGHDAAALAAAGWATTAIDIAPGVESMVDARLGAAGGSLIIGDALSYVPDRPFDLIFDHTFFCALDPFQRPRFGSMADRVLASDGSVISIVFPLGKPAARGGPPWGFGVADLEEALGPGFELVDSGPEDRVPGRAWPHRWTRWERA